MHAVVPNDIEWHALEDEDGENFDDLLEDISPEILQKLIEAKDARVLKALERKRVMELAQNLSWAFMNYQTNDIMKRRLTLFYPSM